MESPPFFFLVVVSTLWMATFASSDKLVEGLVRKMSWHDVLVLNKQQVEG